MWRRWGRCWIGRRRFLKRIQRERRYRLGGGLLSLGDLDFPFPGGVMPAIAIDRRTFLRVSAVSGGGFFLSCHFPGLAGRLAGQAAGGAAPGPGFLPPPFCCGGADGVFTDPSTNSDTGPD